MAPLLSVCIPTFNRGSYLRSTLESIVTQMDSRVEVVISDNASTDDTEQIVAALAATSAHRIVYSRAAENQGADRNYLRSVELATGSYCWLFGSDDIMKPGALALVMEHLPSGDDVYLGGLTICDRNMSVVEDHRFTEATPGESFDLGNRENRLEYFRKACTSTAFFSFLGSIIVSRLRWQEVTLDEERFIGSLWSHVAKIFGMLPNLRLKIIGASLLDKRGDNDSFVNHGMVRRYSVAVDGYRMIADTFFGNHSPEARHIRRVIRNELGIRQFMDLKVRLHEEGSRRELDLLAQLAMRQFDDHDLRCWRGRLLYTFFPLFLYRWYLDWRTS
ncbi:MAG: glycosyltransferase [Magnetococcus sp. WYHC-3]